MVTRFIVDRLLAALSDTPVVFLNGPRQSGKTTLVQSILPAGFAARYVTLDDYTVLAAACQDPEGFIASHRDSLVIDEVQRAPELFLAIKASVDRDRRPGRFLLTGSANVMLLPALAESLVGRMEVVTLWPFSQGELTGYRESWIDRLFAPKPLMNWSRSPSTDLFSRVVRGGYPEAVGRTRLDRRRAWFDSYLSTLMQRDVQDLARIEGLVALPQLLTLLASRVTGLFNVAELSRSIRIPQTTLKRYLTLLETIFLIRFLPPWSGNAGKRLVKAPKLFFGDTGLMASLLGCEGEGDASSIHRGSLLENFVVLELLKQSSWSQNRPRLFHFRTQSGREVDLVLENSAGQIVGIEVKAASQVTGGDFAGLRCLAEAVGEKFVCGVVLYAGEQPVPFTENMVALPVTTLWGGGAGKK